MRLDGWVLLPMSSVGVQFRSEKTAEEAAAADEKAEADAQGALRKAGIIGFDDDGPTGACHSQEWA